MSGTIKCQLANAIKGLAQLKERKDLDISIAGTMPAFEQCIRLQSQIGKIRSEIRAGKLHLAEIRAALSSWTDLLRKLSGEERQTANEEFEKYQAKETLSDLISSYERSLRELAELESEMSIDLQLAEVVKEGEERKAQLAYTQAMADASAKSTTAGGTTGSAFGTIYQLPTLKLKAFTGERKKWPEFYESFRAAIDKRPGSDVEKLTLLRTLLKDEPSELIAGFKLIDKNYQEALTLLKDTYGDKGAYIRGLHSELAGLKHATTVEETRHLSLELERIARELKNAGENIEGPAIYLSLEKKLNKNFLRTILTEKAKDTNSWSTAKFREILLDAVQKETSIHEVMAEFGLMKKPAHTTSPPSKKKDEKKLEYTYAAVESKQQQKGKGRGPNKSDLKYTANIWPPPCAFCQQSHWNKDCTTFPTAQARINAARQVGRCLKCLRIGHDGRNCRRPTKCFQCKKEHPTAICYNTYKNPNGNTAATQLLNGMDHRGTHQFGTTQTSVIPAVQQNVVQQKGTKALLMTLEATVFNPARPHLSTVARIFIDPGSHRSFTTAELADRLQMPVIAKEECELCTFGDMQLKTFTSDLVRLSLLAQGGERITMNVNKLNFVVNPMPIFTLADLEKESLERLKLNPPSAHVKPDILLGMDIWHDLNVRTERQLPSGFILSNSRIGRLISGTGQLANPFSTHTVFALSVTNAEIAEKMAEKEASGNEKLQSEPMEPDKSKVVLDSTLRHESNPEEKLKNSFGFHLPEMEDPLKYMPTNKLAKRLASKRKLRALGKVDKSQIFLDEQLQKGIIKRVEDPNDAIGPVHHLPRLPVNRSNNAPTLCSQKNCLHNSPFLQKDIIGIQLHFKNLKRYLLANNEMAYLRFPEIMASNFEESKVLGISWKREADQMAIKMPQFNDMFTKQKNLSFIAKAYDSLSLLSPSLLPAETLLHSAFEAKNLTTMALWQTEPGPLLKYDFPLQIPWCKTKISSFSIAIGHNFNLSIYSRSMNAEVQTSPDRIFTKIRVRTSDLLTTNEDDSANRCFSRITPKCLQMDEKGWQNPAWLGQSKESWPPSEDTHHPGDEFKPEYRENDGTEHPIDLRRFTKRRRLKMPTVLVLRFTKNNSASKHKFSGEEKTMFKCWPVFKGVPTNSELREGILFLLRTEQKLFLTEEKTNYLEQSLEFFSQRVMNLTMRLIIRCLEEAELQRSLWQMSVPLRTEDQSIIARTIKVEDPNPPLDKATTTQLPTFKAQTTASAQCKAADNDKVLLMTIESTVFNPKDTSKNMKAMIFIDTGSQRSFITAEAAKKLVLPALQTEVCNLKCFGDREPTRYVTERVPLGILTYTGDKIQLSLNKIKFIVDDMPLILIDNTDEKELLRPCLKLPIQMREPDILLGMDTWHTLQVHEERKLPSGFSLCNTMLGQIISGKGQIEFDTLSPASNINFVTPLINTPTEAEKSHEEANMGTDHTTPEEMRTQSSTPTTSKRVKEKSHRKPKKRDTVETAEQITLREDKQIFDEIHANWLEKTNEARQKFRDKNLGENRATTHRPPQQPMPRRPRFTQAFAKMEQDLWGGPTELRRMQEQLRQGTSQQARMEEAEPPTASASQTPKCQHDESRH